MKVRGKFKEVNAGLALIVVGLVFILNTGCATSVPIKSVRPPTIDTSNIQRLALRSFENKSGVGGSDIAQIIQHINNSSHQIITNSGMFTIVAPNDPNAEGVFSGEIRRFAVADRSEQRQRKDKNGNVHNYTLYIRDVSLEFQYVVISTRTGMPIGIVNKNDSRSSSSEQSSQLSSPLSLAKAIVDRELRTLQRDIVPTIVSTKRALIEETSNDKTVKKLMKEAKTLVKNGNYSEAIKQYDQIAAEYNSTAARANANILRESVASEISANLKMAQLKDDISGPAEKAVAKTVEALYSKLPSGSRIIIMKSASTDQNILNNVVDLLTGDVVRGGKLLVVDRQSQALINAEQSYQLSGNVSDETIISIGKQLGAQYIVLCWVSGQMSNRRLTIRILNVETAHIIEQTDYEI